MINLRNKQKSAIVNLVLNTRTEPSRMFLMFSSLLWSLMLFWPGDTFVSVLYHHMSVFGNELIWGVAFFAHACLTICNLLSQDDRPHQVILEAILAFFLWTIATICIALSTYVAPAVMAPHITGTILTWWILLKVGLTNGRLRIA